MYEQASPPTVPCDVSVMREREMSSHIFIDTRALAYYIKWGDLGDAIVVFM